MRPSPSLVREKIRLESENFVLKTMEIPDAELDWGRWTANPTTARMLNAPRRVLSLTERQAYVSSFDSGNNHLLGIWEKPGGDLIGLWSIYVDEQRKEFLLNVLVGSSERRHNGALKETRHLIYQHFFEALGLESARCSVSAQNQQMIDFLLALQWERTGVSRKPSASGAGSVEIQQFRLPREVWRKRTLPAENER